MKINDPYIKAWMYILFTVVMFFTVLCSLALGIKGFTHIVNTF